MSPLTDRVEAVIKVAIYDLALNAAKAAAIAEAPWLNLPIISQVFSYLLTKFADIIYVALSQSVTFTIIDIQTEAQKQAYAEAVAALHSALTPAEGVPDEAAIAQAEAEFKKRLADLIHMDT